MKKSIQEQVGQIIQGRPVIGSATADAIAVKREGMKGKGHKKPSMTKVKISKTRKVVYAKMVAEGRMLAQKI